MAEHINQALHNEKFHSEICRFDGDESFCDWKITTLFYIGLHYLKALAAKKNIDIGESHYDIFNNIRSNDHRASMPLPKTVERNYLRLYQYSRNSRYDGFEDFEYFTYLNKGNYSHAIQCFEEFRKYINGQL